MGLMARILNDPSQKCNPKFREVLPMVHHGGMPSQEIGALLATARRRSDLTQVQLADLTGIDRGQLANYESGKVDPGFTQVVKIARALDLDILGEAVPRDEPAWVEEFRERLAKIEASSIETRTALESAYLTALRESARRRSRAG